MGWATPCSLGVVSLLTLLCGLPGGLSFVLIPLSVLFYLLSAPGLAVVALSFALKRKLRRALSVLLAVASPICLWSPINRAADLVHLGLTVGFGAGQLGSTTRPVGSSFAAYDWSVGLAGGPSTFLIHDVTDEIAEPLSRHKHPISDENGFAEECAGKVEHLVSHYYVCTF